MAEKKRYIFLQILAGVALAAAAVCVSVTLALNSTWLYERDIKAFGLEERTGLTKAKLMEDYRTLISYNNLFGEDELSFRHFRMSREGAQHFREVRDIFKAFQIAGIASLLLAMLLIYYLNKKRAGTLFLLVSSIAPACVLALLLAVFMAIGWDRSFVLFHEIAFDNDYWIFDASTDPVITALPDGFFFHEAALILALVACFSFIFITLYIKTAKKK